MSRKKNRASASANSTRSTAQRCCSEHAVLAVFYFGILLTISFDMTSKVLCRMTRITTRSCVRLVTLLAGCARGEASSERCCLQEFGLTMPRALQEFRYSPRCMYVPVHSPKLPCVLSYHQCVVNQVRFGPKNFCNKGGVRCHVALVVQFAFG